MPFGRDDHANSPARKAFLWDRHGLADGGSRYEGRQAVAIRSAAATPYAIGQLSIQLYVSR